MSGKFGILIDIAAAAGLQLNGADCGYVAAACLGGDAAAGGLKDNIPTADQIALCLVNNR